MISLGEAFAAVAYLIQKLSHSSIKMSFIGKCNSWHHIIHCTFTLMWNRPNLVIFVIEGERNN